LDLALFLSFMSNKVPIINPKTAIPQLRKIIKPAKAKMNLYKIKSLKKRDRNPAQN
jgi:hypothetical protein